MSRYIITCIGMDVDKCKLIEDQLNNDNGDKYIWVFDKPTNTFPVFDKYVRYFISAPSMDTERIKKLTDELNDKNSPKKYWVINESIMVDSIYEEPE